MHTLFHSHLTFTFLIYPFFRRGIKGGLLYFLYSPAQDTPKNLKSIWIWVKKFMSSVPVVMVNIPGWPVFHRNIWPASLSCLNTMNVKTYLYVPMPMSGSYLMKIFPL